jgi:hypothetical protein
LIPDLIRGARIFFPGWWNGGEILKALSRENDRSTCYGHIGLADRSRCCVPEAWCWVDAGMREIEVAE